MEEYGIPTIENIREAENFLNGKINRTPMDYSATLSSQFSCSVYLKLENLQKTGSFKARGALLKMNSLSQEERKRGVIAVSAGNHAQGVAYAGQIMGIGTKIVMPEFTTPAKVNAVERYGADIVLKGKDYSEAREIALEIAGREGRAFIEGFDDFHIIAGQGTIGLEIMKDLPDTDIIVVPAGGGGLISGIAIAAKTIRPEVRIIGVQSEKIDSIAQSMAKGRIVSSVKGETIADGIAIRTPGKLNIEIIKKYVDEIVTVSDETMAYALFRLLERNKILVEPSGAAPLAALMENRVNVKGKKVVLVLSGGNANLLMLSKIIFKSMEMENQLIRIELTIPDKPGTLYRIAQAISESGGNIYHAEVDNLKEDTPVGHQSVTFSVNVRDRKHSEVLLEKLKNIGFPFRTSSNQTSR
ncbi:MAG: threonine ammonia-lyase [Candidatus Thermoplasmatota archaeon]|nr:threonine ammonia-lyase [Candidatus Thermoplasmatota archaeon]MCL5731009.1 threonine ammonia-lyase [Candidatus Thermoplasmatota archaeon]